MEKMIQDTPLKQMMDVSSFLTHRFNVIVDKQVVAILVASEKWLYAYGNSMFSKHGPAFGKG